MESFFQTKDALREKYGEIKDAGPAGWQEITNGTRSDMGSINWLMFHMIPEGAQKQLTSDDMTVWDMFVTPALIDLD